MKSSSRISYSLAAETAKINRESRIGSRGTDANRMEPACWPSLRPSFTFDKESKIFVIGSCFATNIEKYLQSRGYICVSSCENRSNLISTGCLNKYTPASIWEEIAWAREIYDRDDSITLEDVQKCLFQVSGELYIDLHLHAVEPVDLATALEWRKVVYSIYRDLFTCDVVVITLGLIESWYDERSERYICETPPRQALREKERFFFEQLDYQKCYKFVVSAIELIRKTNSPRIMLTTSPVVLQRTFTSDDVIVANMFSKSVLRAVTGQVVKDLDGIDYFPSYESVMLTRQNSIWKDDMMHVAEPFIAQIMSRVEGIYAPESFSKVSDNFDRIHDFVNAVSARDFSLARSIFTSIGDPGLEVPSDYYTSAAVLYWCDGDRNSAASILAKSSAGELSYTDVLVPLRILIARWAGDKDLVIGVRSWLKANDGLTFKRLFHAASWLSCNGNKREAAVIAGLVRPQQVRRLSAQRRLVSILQAGGKADQAKIISEIKFDSVPAVA